MRNYVVLITAIVFSGTLAAQDFIHLKDQSYVKCKILEVTPEYIRYKNYPVTEDGTIFTIEKFKVLEIAMEDGTKMTFEHSGNNSFNAREHFFGQNTRAIKFDFLAPASDALLFKYEQSINPGRSWEAWLGIPGAGFKIETSANHHRPRGIFVGGGYKFMKTPDYLNKNVRRSHLLSGYYVRPSLVFTSHSYETLNSVWDPINGLTISKDRQSVTGLGFLLYVGRQWVFEDIFLVDFNVGIGYAVAEGESRYGFFGSSLMPVIYNGSLSIGILFDTKNSKGR